jgi:hypothetical protein
MRTHKKQHFVPQGYLRAWCDPATLAHQKRYVWRFNKDGSAPRRKAPKNIFHETDLYTIHLPNGERDLVLEHGLASLENAFVKIRDSILSRRKGPTPAQRVMLCAFMAAAQARTPTQRDHLGGQWAQVLEQMEHMEDWAKTATPEQRRDASTLGQGSGPSLRYEDVKRMAEKPMETWLMPQIEAATPLLAGLDFAVVECDRERSFITSDNPCVWFDPQWHTRPPLYQAPALIYPSTEITLPISPRQLIWLNRHGRSGYFSAGERPTEEFNRRTRFQCSEYFVSNSNRTKPEWFDPGVEPEDSWRKRHPDEAVD